MSELEPIGDIAEHKLDSLENVSTGKHGGPRPNSGRRKGSVNKATKDAKEAKKQFVERVNKNVEKLFNSQMDLAVGEKYLMVIKTIGKGTKAKRETSIVTDPDTIKKFLDEDLEDSETEYYFMTTKPANNMALDSLLNRSFGKATEKIEFDGGIFKKSKFIFKVVDARRNPNSTVEPDPKPGARSTE